MVTRRSKRLVFASVLQGMLFLRFGDGTVVGWMDQTIVVRIAAEGPETVERAAKT